MSALGALGSAYVGWSNRELAEAQAGISRMQYTPQLGLDVQEMSGWASSPVIRTSVRIKNVGTITVYNASVRTAMAMLEPNNTGAIWQMLDPGETGITLAPTETETAAIIAPSPDASHLALVESGQLVVVVGAMIQYRDELGRDHTRYVCSKFHAHSSGLVGTFCPAPPQS